MQCQNSGCQRVEGDLSPATLYTGVSRRVVIFDSPYYGLLCQYCLYELWYTERNRNGRDHEQGAADGYDAFSMFDVEGE